MPTAPTAITPLPTAPSRADPANFPTRADAFLAALPTFGSQLNANASAAYTNASDSVTAANNAAASETNAAASAIAAAASALTALNAPGTSGTSTTSLTIGTGSQTFTTQTGKAWVVGQFVTVASTASPTNFMHGQITAYNSGTGSMTVNVLAVGGSGTLASWTIGLVGPNATLTDQNSLQPVALTLPSIRPSLLLDFANSKKLDSRITFTRATSGTYYDGVTTAKAEENLLLRSQDFSATWTLANLTAGSAVTAPDGTATGSSFTASAANGTLTQSVPAIAAEYTFSVYLRRVTGTGNIDITAHSGGTWVTQSITSSWARYTVTQTLTAGTRTPGIRIVTSGDQIEVWGAQFEQRSAATAYTPTTTQPITNYIPQLLTAPDNTPRFDHNPTTGESLGLLVEEQRTNLVLYSQQFDDGYWGKTRLSVEPNTVVAPDGTLTGDKLVENTDLNTHTVQASAAGIAATNAITTFSFYAKAAGRTKGRCITLSFNWNATFDLGAETVSSTTGTSSIQAVGNGWYRLSFTSAANITASFTPRIDLAENAGNLTYQGDGYSGIFIWGAQLEAGAFPTSYIPTTSASVTRTADAPSMTGLNFSSWYRNDKGSLYFEAIGQSGLGAFYPAMLTGSTGSTLNGYYINTQLVISTRSDGNNAWSDTSSWLSTGYVANQNQKFMFAFENGSCATVNNGSVVESNTQALAQVSPAALTIGASFTGRYKKLAYYPARLTNAQLQALTA